MHRILAEAAAGIAKSVFREHRVLDHELAAAFEENPKWGKRDRGFIAETVFEVVRWRRALEAIDAHWGRRLTVGAPPLLSQPRWRLRRDRWAVLGLVQRPARRP